MIIAESAYKVPWSVLIPPSSHNFFPYIDRNTQD